MYTFFFIEIKWLPSTQESYDLRYGPYCSLQETQRMIVEFLPILHASNYEARITEELYHPSTGFLFIDERLKEIHAST